MINCSISRFQQILCTRLKVSARNGLAVGSGGAYWTCAIGGGAWGTPCTALFDFESNDYWSPGKLVTDISFNTTDIATHPAQVSWAFDPSGWQNTATFFPAEDNPTGGPISLYSDPGFINPRYPADNFQFKIGYHRVSVLLHSPSMPVALAHGFCHNTPLPTFHCNCSLHLSSNGVSRKVNHRRLIQLESSESIPLITTASHVYRLRHVHFTIHNLHRGSIVANCLRNKCQRNFTTGSGS